MWKDYSLDYIKNNRASGLSVMVAALFSSVLLSLLCGLFYNLWVYEIERIKVEEGDWQGRIVGEINGETLDLIGNYANVEKAVVNEELSEDGQKTVDLYFKNKRSIFTDMPRIADLAGLSKEAAVCHYALLNLYLVRSPQDAALRWVFPFALLIMAVACLSLVLVIHNAFAVTMQARIHQFGIFSGIGATPGQIRTCLLQEAFAVCAGPVLAGNLLGILACMGTVEGLNWSMADVEGRMALPFAYHPLILLFSLLATALTIWLSAWIPAGKMSRLTPLEAIRNAGELSLNRKKNSRVAAFLFGVEGELAANAIKAQRKALRTATISLTLSFLAFFFMTCFFTIMVVSQRETYFEKYQDAWDIMVMTKETGTEAFEDGDAIRELAGVESVAVYQKAKAKRIVLPEEISGQMRDAGGFADAPAQYVTAFFGGWLVNAPLVILDDTAFLEYCAQIKAEQRLDGAVILNLTHDAADPNFRKRRAFPYLTGEEKTTRLLQDGGTGQAVEIPVLAYAVEAPVLREEYGTLDLYEMVHFISSSCWEERKGQIGGAPEETYIRILAKDRTSPDGVGRVEEEVSAFLEKSDRIVMENRVRERRDNDRMFDGMTTVVSIFCILLAVIGIGNVFSNTLGFVRSRRREFARYLSIGLTPDGMKKIFCVEALVLAGRPVLFVTPVTAAAVAFFIKISYLEPMLFIREIPFIPILAFVLAVFLFVALAYGIGAKKVLAGGMIDSLRDDTML